MNVFSHIRISVFKHSIAMPLCLAFSLTLGAIPGLGQTYRVLYPFADGPDGGASMAGVIVDAEGTSYGTTSSGGKAGCFGQGGCGVVFKVDKTGKETVLYRFTNSGKDGREPEAGLARDHAGNLYGTTYWGGGTGCNAGQGCGIVFKVDTTGKETVLHVFTGYPNDGEYPLGVILGKDGALYGTTYVGGSGNWGTVFKVDKTGKETVLHSFNRIDGAGPFGRLLLDSAGNLYGTTYRGGNSGNSCDGMDCGVVFKLNKNGKETILYNFTGSQDGGNPYAGLVQDAAGNLYGTTANGGIFGRTCTYGCGTVFKLDKTRKETVLYSFTGSGGDGKSPRELVLGAAGELYGTTGAGGADGYGTIFKLDTAGTESVLYNFCCWHGKNPSGVTMDKVGNLYGTTYAGGASGAGVVFRFTP